MACLCHSEPLFYLGVNIRVLLPLLREYQVTELTERCETYLLEKENPSIDNVLLAWQFNLDRLLEKNKSYVIKTIPTKM